MCNQRITLRIHNADCRGHVGRFGAAIAAARIAPGPNTRLPASGSHIHSGRPRGPALGRPVKGDGEAGGSHAMGDWGGEVATSLRGATLLSPNKAPAVASCDAT